MMPGDGAGVGAVEDYTGARRLIGNRLLDRDGTAVGRIGQVFFDDRTREPAWVTVRTGVFGTGENFVPLRGAHPVDEGLRVPFDAETIRSAPSFSVDRHISVEQEDAVFEHYGLAPEVPGPREPYRPRHRRPEPGEAAPAGGGPGDTGEEQVDQLG